MRRRALLIDAALGALFAVLILILAPGLAIAAMIAITVLLAGGVSYAVQARGRGRRRRGRRPR